MAQRRAFVIAEKASLEYRDQSVLDGWPGDLASSTLADGAAGIAYFLLRHAGVGGGRESLEAAAAWAARAEQAVEQDDGTGQAGSLYFGAPGVWWASALVAAARHERQEAARTAERFA